MGSKLTIAYYIKMLAERYEGRPAIYFKSAFRTFGFTYREIHERCRNMLRLQQVSMSSVMRLKREYNSKISITGAEIIS